ncbi:hypothetical protein FAZ69_01705 [Trinickia terrae]|uniref:Uncharacterized protein n=1 Tax=Trinickia terrae TaxID=2571161 RepID=A0A4U1IFB8_9BURK|nr:hypothetical protein [Trinickia terrae]TKC92419.1 hypothetical protein FAZ69_01705 [Trinickia terrae]
MPNISDIHRLVTDMNNKNILNTSTTLNDLLSISADNITNPGVQAGWYALGGDHYVIVCGQNPGSAVINQGAAAQGNGQ